MSAIEWTGKTWNPLRGCRRVSPGCGLSDAGGCYAERIARRFSGQGNPYEGLARSTRKGPRWTGDTFVAHEVMTQPIRRRKPTVYFVNSMGDLFYSGHSDEDIDSVFGVMWACLYAKGRAGDDGVPGHIFQVLTKRAERMREYMTQDRRAQHARAAVDYGGGRDPDGIHDMVLAHKGPHPRIWCGVSAEDQQRADERIPHLVETPAAVHFVSAEPLLEDITLDVDWLLPRCSHCRCHSTRELGGRCFWATCSGTQEQSGVVDWVIAGAESGPRARPADWEWFRRVKNQCVDAQVPFFLKQWCENGRKQSTPVLDGETWTQMPEVNR